MIEIEPGAWRVGQERYPATLQEVRATTATGRSLLSVHLRSPITPQYLVEVWFAHFDRDAALGAQVGAHVALRVWEGPEPLPLDPRPLPSGRISAPEILHGLRSDDVEEIVRVLREASNAPIGEPTGSKRLFLRRANGQWLLAAGLSDLALRGEEAGEPADEQAPTQMGEAPAARQRPLPQLNPQSPDRRREGTSEACS